MVALFVVVCTSWPLPLIFTLLASVPGHVMSQGVMLLRPSLSIQRDPQVLVVESCLDSVDGKQSGFQSKVVVIHAQDTREDALQLASQLRNPMEGNRLYVLLLQESKKNTQVKSSLRCDPWNSIHKWFIKVDAVLPVLSPQLLRQIQNRDFSRESEWEKRYNRFAHSMMLDQHVEYGSKNGFCRAVCPARFPEETSSSSSSSSSSSTQEVFSV
ncbi:uncharacterized protein LOC135107742 isoform X1 [Scylla paramamosain]|uniref:uncharacterized protein LOC135101676 isoform X1 n=2 Tax=Scylla paramamosain TaxID=85552 RepID=UPI0030831EA5